MTYFEIVNKLIEPITPSGRSEIDSTRYDNLEEYIKLIEKMIGELDYIQFHYKDSHEYSVQKIGKRAYEFLQEIKYNDQD